MNISFVIPVYNASRYIRECLDSLLALSRADWECVCVDDGSTDDSGAILDSYAEKDARFRVIHKKNSGVSAARNDGMSAACGEYVIFVDADDAVVPWMLDDIDESMSREPGCDFYVFSPQPVIDMSVPLPTRHSGLESLERIDINNDIAAQVAYERVDGSLLAWGACYRRDLAVTIGFKNYPNGEDALFGYTCLCRAKSIAFLGSQLYRYRLPRPGSANNATFKNLKSCLDIVDEYRSVGKTWPYTQCVRSIAARKARSGLVGVVYSILLKLPPQDRREGRRYFMASLCQRLFVYDDPFPCVDKAFMKLACRLNSLLLFHVCVYWPFLIRAKLARVPFVHNLKDTIRHPKVLRKEMP